MTLGCEFPGARTSEMPARREPHLPSPGRDGFSIGLGAGRSGSRVEKGSAGTFHENLLNSVISSMDEVFPATRPLPLSRRPGLGCRRRCIRGYFVRGGSSSCFQMRTGGWLLWNARMTLEDEKRPLPCLPVDPTRSPLFSLRPMHCGVGGTGEGSRPHDHPPSADHSVRLHSVRCPFRHSSFRLKTAGMASRAVDTQHSIVEIY